MKIAKHIRSLPRAGIRVLFDMANRMEDVIHLEIGCPDLPTPAAVCDAGIDAIRSGQTRYTPNAGIDELRASVASYASRRKAIRVGADNVVITTGGMGGLASTFAAVLDPGDEVLVPDPGWPNYSMQISCCNGVPIAYDLCRESKCRPQTSKIESLITERTKAIVVNSPSNPTGAVIEEETAHEILDLARGKGILVVSDELASLTWNPGFRKDAFKEGRARAVQIVEKLCKGMTNG